MATQKQTSWKRELHEIIYEADTPNGKLFDLILLITILASIVLVMLESIDSINDSYGTFLNISEWIITGLFTLEYILRIIAIKKPLSKVTMFEKNKKKAYFIKKTIRTLGLKNAKIVDKAITPELITDTPFDVVTARALAPANKIVNMSQHLLTKT